MSDENNKTVNQMWGGRFDAQPDDIMTQINASIDVDKRLYKQDIDGSKAHAAMLVTQDIISPQDGDKIQSGLNQILQEIEDNQFEFSTALEDIHMNIESRLKNIIGDSAGKLHTARSRNDQAVTSHRMWVREACDMLMVQIAATQKVIQKIVTEHKKTIMPGFTHLQVAQPVTLAMHFGAYYEMLERDKSRIENCRERLNKCPLGSAALSGTGFNIDRNMTAQSLGFKKPTENTMDSVSSRDFACEFLFCCAQCGINLSRLAEELILWSTPQFGFVTLSDMWSTGSSIMPQKKNPDAAELVRAKTGKLNGNLIQFMTVMKGLPLTYNKDMQEDKACVFESFDTTMLCLKASEGMISTMTIHKDNMLEAAQSGYSTATEIADWLVRTLDTPFREAHHITGAIVKIAETKSCRLDQLSLKDMQSVDNRITDDIFSVLSVENALKLRNVI